MAGRVAEVACVVAHSPHTGGVCVAFPSACTIREAPRDRRGEDRSSAQACHRGMQPRPAPASGFGGPRMCAVPSRDSQGMLAGQSSCAIYGLATMFIEGGEEQA
jgi:hypothetical protein